jgi:phenylalanine-4-hydroxylase
MKYTRDGIEVDGTPLEIAEFIRAMSKQAFETARKNTWKKVVDTGAPKERKRRKATYLNYREFLGMTASDFLQRDVANRSKTTDELIDAIYRAGVPREVSRRRIKNRVVSWQSANGLAIS